MKITNDANTTIIGSNTTVVVVPDSDNICTYVAVICNSGKTYKIEKECYNALKELFDEENGNINSNKPVIKEQ